MIKKVEEPAEGLYNLTNKNKNKNWIIGILVGVIVLLAAGLFTSICLNSSITKNYLSNVAQFTSITMAIVAIVYAFNQTSQSQSQYDRMNETLQNIIREVVKLQTVQKDVIESKEKLDNLTSAVSKTIDMTKTLLPGETDNKIVDELNRVSKELEKIKHDSEISNLTKSNGLLFSSIPVIGSLTSSFENLGKITSDSLEIK